MPRHHHGHQQQRAALQQHDTQHNIRDSQFLPSDSEDDSDGFFDSADEENSNYDPQERRPLLNKNGNADAGVDTELDAEMDSFAWNWSSIYRFYHDYAPLMRIQRSIPFLNRFSSSAICWIIIPFKIAFWLFVGYLILTGGDVSRYSSHIPGWYAADNTANTAETDDLITTTATDGMLHQIDNIVWSKDSFHPIHGDLWERVRELSMLAKDNGALQTIEVTSKSQLDQGMEFLIFKPVDENVGKTKTMIKSKVSDPIAIENIEDSLIIHRFVNEETASSKSIDWFAYSIVLNKFNTVPHHCLLVSDKFASQIHPITKVEFGLWFYALFNGNSKSGGKGVGFYNSDAISGASQKHKHLQLIPAESIRELREDGAANALPLDDLVFQMREKHQVFPVQVQHSGSSANKFLYKLPEFKFQHGYALLDSDWMSSQMSAGALGLVAEYLQNVYSLLLSFNQIDQGVLYRCAAGTTTDQRCQASSHNIILTESYMFIIPRQKPKEDLNINAMGFFGLLLTHEPERSDVLRVQGPMAVLTAVTKATSK